MKNAPPRTDLEIVIAEMKRRERLLAADWATDIAFMEGLRDQELVPEVQFLLRYMVSGERLRSAAWANDKGWKFKPLKGNRRPFKDVDVNALLDTPPSGWSARLVALVKDSCFDDRGMMNTGKMMS